MDIGDFQQVEAMIKERMGVRVCDSWKNPYFRKVTVELLWNDEVISSDFQIFQENQYRYMATDIHHFGR